MEVTLAILSSPKPTTVLFYLARGDGSVPPQWRDADINAGYDGDVSLRGRKVYRHHGQTREDVYRREDTARDDQNRTARDVLPPGNKFEFTIEFDNLAPVELGALLWSLEMDG